MAAWGKFVSGKRLSVSGGSEPVYRASVFKPEQSESVWKTALGRLPQPHALQSWTWGAFKARWGWSAQRLLLTVGGNSWEPLAAALVLKRKIPRTPFSILYVPKGPVLDYRDGALRRVVLAELEKIARRERAIFVKIDPDVVKSWGVEKERPSPTGARFMEELKARGWRYSDSQIQFPHTVELDLTRSEDDLLASMKQKTRYNIRLAGRKGVTVRVGELSDYPLIADMYQETAVRDGFAIRPRAYYLDIWRAFHADGMGIPFIAEYEGQPLAALVLVTYGERAIYMYGASTNEERNRMPTYLLQWEAICWAKAHGYRVYDFWGAPTEFAETDPLWGVWRFKAGFNGQVVRHLGAWDYPVRPFLYWLYVNAIPRYVSWLRGRSPNTE